MWLLHVFSESAEWVREKQSVKEIESDSKRERDVNRWKQQKNELFSAVNVTDSNFLTCHWWRSWSLHMAPVESLSLVAPTVRSQVQYIITFNMDYCPLSSAQCINKNRHKWTIVSFSCKKNWSMNGSKELIYLQHFRFYWQKLQNRILRTIKTRNRTSVMTRWEQTMNWKHRA